MYKSWVPVRSKLPLAAKACIELANCGFKSCVVAVFMQESQMEMQRTFYLSMQEIVVPVVM